MADSCGHRSGRLTQQRVGDNQVDGGVDVHDGTVRICGRVQSFYERQLCLTCCQRQVGVRQVVDEIEVTLSASNYFPSQLDQSPLRG